MANITPTTAATLIPEVWTSDILDVVKAQLVLEPRVHNYDSLAYGKGKGDILHIPSLVEGDADQKSAGTDVTFDAVTEGEIQLSINQHWYDAYQIEDITKVQANPDLMKIYTDKAGYSVAKKKDATIADLYTGFSQNVDAAGSDLVDSEILRAIQYLDDANAPMSDRHFVVKPQVKADVMGLSKFVLFDSTGPGPDGARVQTGQVGSIYGVEFAVTTQIVTATKTQNLMFHRDAIGISSAIDMRIQSQYRIEALGTAVVADSLWGVAETRDTFGVVVSV